MNTTKISSFILFMLLSSLGVAQYQWKLRDPLDLDFVDFGDNKVLLYNGIGVGLTYLLDGSAKYQDSSYADWELGLTAFKGYRPELTGSIAQFAIRRRFLIKRFWALGVEGRVLSYINSPVPGVGFSPTFTWYIINKKKVRLAYDNGVGPNLFLSAFPEGGTSFNFSTFYGLKIEAKLGVGWYHFGIYNLHISNADIKGRERNPPFDGVGISVGMSLR